MDEKEKIEHFDRLARDFDKWKSRNPYYHEQIARFYSSIIPKKSRVLQVGSSTGTLLARLDPEYGLGLDISEKMVSIARAKYPQLRFETGQLNDIAGDTGFDYVVLANLMDYLSDCWDFLRELKKFAASQTKIIITNVNPLWEPVMNLAAALRLKTPDIPRNYITKKDLANLLGLCGYEIIEEGYRILLPKKIFFISGLVNKLFSRIPVINNLCCLQYIVARIRPAAGAQALSCSVIIPCFNEKDNIGECIRRIPPMGTFTQIIVVDDGSGDGTGQIVKEIMRQRNDLTLLSHPANRGKAMAVRTGIQNASGDVLIILDADMAVPPEELPKFFLAIAEGQAEFVNGTRMIYPMEKGAMRFMNFLGNKMFGIILSLLNGQRNTDTLCGTKAILRKYCRHIEVNSSWGDFDLLFGAAKLKLKLVEMPVHYKKRAFGKSKMRALRDGFLLLGECWRWFKGLA